MANYRCYTPPQPRKEPMWHFKGFAAFARKWVTFIGGFGGYPHVGWRSPNGYQNNKYQDARQLLRKLAILKSICFDTPLGAAKETPKQVPKQTGTRMPGFKNQRTCHFENLPKRNSHTNTRSPQTFFGERIAGTNVCLFFHENHVDQQGAEKKNEKYAPTGTGMKISFPRSVLIPL